MGKQKGDNNKFKEKETKQTTLKVATKVYWKQFRTCIYIWAIMIYLLYKTSEFKDVSISNLNLFF